MALILAVIVLLYSYEPQLVIKLWNFLNEFLPEAQIQSLFCLCFWSWSLLKAWNIHLKWFFATCIEFRSDFLPVKMNDEKEKGINIG